MATEWSGQGEPALVLDMAANTCEKTGKEKYLNCDASGQR